MSDVLAASAERVPWGGRLPLVRSVAVLGAGTMGAQIAAHFANAGVPALLLDLTPEAARQGLERARSSSPIRSSRPTRRLITTGGFDKDLAALADADWVIEAVVERLDVKRTLLAKVDAARRADVDRQLQHVGHPDRRARRGPQRRLPPPLARHALLQPAALPAAARGHPDAGHRSRRSSTPSREFADQRLGKGVVVAKDTPNFIGNHIALFGVMRMLEARREPASYTHRRDRRHHRAGARPAEERDVPHADLAGLDILAHVVAQPARAAAGRRTRGVPRCRRSWSRCSSRGWLGEKAGQGFYKRVKNARGESEILDARSRDARLSAETVGAAPLARRRQVHRRRARARAHAVQRQRQGRRVPARDAGADARLRRAGRAHDRALASTTWIA